MEGIFKLEFDGGPFEYVYLSSQRKVLQFIAWQREWVETLEEANFVVEELSL